MSAVDVYRLQQAKLLFDTSDISEGDKFYLVDENNNEKIITITNLDTSKPFYIKPIEGGHIYSLYAKNGEDRENIFLEEVILSGQIMQISLWDGVIYNQGTWWKLPNSFIEIARSGAGGYWEAELTNNPTNGYLSTACHGWSSTNNNATIQCGMNTKILGKNIKKFEKLYLDLTINAVHKALNAYSGQDWLSLVDVYFINTTDNKTASSKTVYENRSSSLDYNANITAMLQLIPTEEIDTSKEYDIQVKAYSWSDSTANGNARSETRVTINKIYLGN